MISMTGYGQFRDQNNGEEIRIAANSVNNRYLEVVIKTPHRFQPLHSLIKKTVSSRVFRGKIYINLEYHDFRTEKNDLRLDKGLMANYVEILKTISADLGCEEIIPVDLVARYPGMIVSFEEDPEVGKYWEWLQPILIQALERHQSNCMDEGIRTRTDIVNRLEIIQKVTEGIVFSQPELKQQYLERIQKRLEELPVKFQMDENRLYSEIALIIDRFDITEELVRLASHLEKMNEIIQSDEKSIGKKLDFYCQELNREINTLGSKINCTKTIDKVVDVKNEIEKIREQLQNVV